MVFLLETGLPDLKIEITPTPFIWFFFVASIVLFLWALIYFLVQIVFRRPGYQLKHEDEHREHKSLQFLLLITTLILFGSVWNLRFSADLFALTHPELNLKVEATHWVDSLFGCVLHALQTVSLDESYAVYVEAVKAMAGSLICENAWVTGAFGVYASILNVATPLFGGAVLVELLSELFPQVKLWWIRNFSHKDKYYFSELNEKSLALAKSILKKTKSVRLIFADVLRDDISEDERDMVDEAQRYGGVCVRDDIMLIRFSKSWPFRHLAKLFYKFIGKSLVYVFLIDDNENSNLQMLTSLLSQEDEILKRANIYIFQSDDKESRFEEEVSFIIDQQRKIIMDNASPEEKGDEKGVLRERLPNVIPVNGVRNMAMLQMMRMPLFEPLADRTDESGRRLHVVIFGSGVIGMELFLNVTWFGQMLDRELHITVISKEPQTAHKQAPSGETDGSEHGENTAFPGEEDSGGCKGAAQGGFKDRLNRLNPEILQSCNKDSDFLKCRDEKTNPPYFHFEYVETDVMLGDLSSTLKQVDVQEELSLLDADYYIVSLGSDEDNFTVADQLRQIVAWSHIEKANTGNDVKHTVISYVIYNSALCNSLNKCCGYSYSPEGNDIYMRAFGSMEEVYGVDSVMFDNIQNEAVEIGAIYEGKHRDFLHRRALAGRKKREEKERNANKVKRALDSYSYYANIARRSFRMHLAFSAGVEHKSVFACGDYNLFQQELKQMEEQLKEKVFRIPSDDHKMKMLYDLAWLEHRRWCAFMRSKGFRNPGGSLEKYLSMSLPEHKPGRNKILPLKLHGCLVESDREERFAAEYDDAGFLVVGTEVSHDTDGDTLDKVTDTVNGKNEKPAEKTMEEPEDETQSEAVNGENEKPAEETKEEPEEEAQPETEASEETDAAPKAEPDRRRTAAAARAQKRVSAEIRQTEKMLSKEAEKRNAEAEKERKAKAKTKRKEAAAQAKKEKAAARAGKRKKAMVWVRADVDLKRKAADLWAQYKKRTEAQEEENQRKKEAEGTDPEPNLRETVVRIPKEKIETVRKDAEAIRRKESRKEHALTEDAAKQMLEAAKKLSEERKNAKSIEFFKRWDFPQYGYGSAEVLSAQYDICKRPRRNMKALDDVLDVMEVHCINGKYYASPKAVAEAVCGTKGMKKALSLAKNSGIIVLAVEIAAEKESLPISELTAGSQKSDKRPNAEEKPQLKMFPLDSLQTFYELQLQEVYTLMYWQYEADKTEVDKTEGKE